MYIELLRNFAYYFNFTKKYISTMRWLFTFIVCLLLTNHLISQSLVGVQSNYSGSGYMALNPAELVSSNHYFDFTLFSVTASVDNDFMFVYNKDLTPYLFDRLIAHNFDNSWPKVRKGDKVFNYDFHNNSKNKNLFEAIDINLFSCMFALNKKTALAFSINNRIYSNVTNIPSEIPMMMTYEFDSTFWNDNFSSNKKIRIANLDWSEIAIAYSRNIYERFLKKIDVGVTGKFLIGYAEAAATIDNVNFMIFNSDSLRINNSDAYLAYSLPFDYSLPFEDYNNEYGSFNKLLNKIKENSGIGFAFDLGFVYTKKADTKISNARRRCMLPKSNYQWKLGISLTDIGAITFNKNAVEHHFLINDKILSAQNFDSISCFQDLTDTLSKMSYGTTDKSFVSNKVVIGLPTSLNLQFDYRLVKNFYVKLFWIQPFRLFKYSVTKVPKIAISPRYESDLIDFGIPVTLYNYSHANVGFFFRIACLTIGTENVGALCGFGKSHGTELYVSLKFYLTKGHCLGPERDACWSESAFVRNKEQHK